MDSDWIYPLVDGESGGLDLQDKSNSSHVGHGWIHDQETLHLFRSVWARGELFIVNLGKWFRFQFPEMLYCVVNALASLRFDLQFAIGESMTLHNPNSIPQE